MSFQLPDSQSTQQHVEREHRPRRRSGLLSAKFIIGAIMAITGLIMFMDRWGIEAPSSANFGDNVGGNLLYLLRFILIAVGGVLMVLGITRRNDGLS